MRRVLLSIALTLSYTLGACASDPLLNAPPPSRLIATVKLAGTGPVGVRVDATRGDFYYLSESGKRIVVMNGLTVTHIITEVGSQATLMFLAVLPEQHMALTLGTTRGEVAILRNYQFAFAEATGLDRANAIVANERLGIGYIVGTKGNVQSPAKDLGVVIPFAADKRLPEIGLGRFFPDAALVDPKHNLLYIRGRVAEPVIQVTAATRITVETLIQVWRGEERISSLPINDPDELWEIDPATGDVFLALYDQALKKQVLRRYNNGAAVQDVAYPLVNGATRSCPWRVGAMGVSSRDKRVYVADLCQRAVLVFKDMVYEGFVPTDAREVFKMAVDQDRAIAYFPDLREDKVTAIRGTTVLTTYKTGWYPYALVVNPLNGWLYVGNTNDATVSVFGY